MLVQIAVMPFADQVEFARGDRCYSKDLALMTPANKDELSAFVAITKAPTGARANFSNAFKEAFRMLINDSDTVRPGNKPRG